MRWFLNSYSNDIEKEIMSHFDARIPLAKQPQYIVHTKCRDGKLLKQIYQMLCNNTERGKHLQEYPLTLIAVDTDNSSLSETENNLKGLPHITLLSALTEPLTMIEAMKKSGINDLEAALYIQTLVNHADQPDEEPLSIQNWRQVLNNNPHGLLILQEHSLPSADAEAFLLSAAKAGLFTPNAAIRFPKSGRLSKVTLNHFETRDYQVRLAEITDLDALDKLEKLCWKAEIQTPREVLAKRLNAYPQGQFVMEYAGKVIGVIYSQRINSETALKKRTAEDVLELHRDNGAIIQLLAVNIDPQYQERQWGNQLLEFMLQRCALLPNLKSVVAVTLCKGFHKQTALPIKHYINSRNEYGRLVDPVLGFHERHGAQIIGLISDYRANDLDNKGYGVLVRYDIYHRVPLSIEIQPSSDSTDAGDDMSLHASTQDSAPIDVADSMTELFTHLLGKDNENAFAPDSPIMEMGLDSADVLSLSDQISARFNLQLPSAFFFEFNTPARIIDYIKAHAAKEHSHKAPLMQDSPIAEHPHETITVSTTKPRDAETRHADTSLNTKDIAIIGMSCRLPGNIETPDELWQLLQAEKSAIGELPENRWHWPSSINPKTQHKGIDLGGFLPDIARFDAPFFRLSRKEAELIDPQQRLLLELTWAALEDCGYTANSSTWRETGVFIGASGSDYRLMLEQQDVQVQAQMATGNSMAILANRISYFYDWQGPSLVIDTACSSSLVAVHEALRALHSGECSQALVGGINIICHPGNTLAYYKSGMLSTEGRCHTFDAGANGYVRSEGAVVLMLKPLAQALADHDQIHAVIKGSAVNHGGKASGLTAPNPARQTQLIQKAWRNAGINPGNISYIEAHGTGTALGDPIEIRGLTEAFSTYAKNTSATKCGVGSLKTNLGHLEAAAGIAGLLKVILSFKHQSLAASINFKKLNPEINLKNTPLYVVDKYQPWASPEDAPRMAGVSSFGSGGTNSHVVLAEFISAEPAELAAAAPVLITLSAKNRERLTAYATRLVNYLETQSQTGQSLSLASFAYSLQRRYPMEERIAFVVSSMTQLRESLHRLSIGQPVAGSYQGTVKSAPPTSERPEIKSDLSCPSGEHELNAIGEGWVKGDLIGHWSVLYSPLPTLISLPTYPFATEQYWFHVSASDDDCVTSHHSLVIENDSNVFSTTFGCRLSGNEFFLTDHQIEGRKILPAAAYLEIARECISRAYEHQKSSSSETVHQSEIVLEDIVWLSPVIVDDQPVSLKIDVLPQNENTADFQIYSLGNDGEQFTYCKGRGRLTDTQSRKNISDENGINTLLSGVSAMKSVEVYEKLLSMGLQYGSAHQPIDTLKLDEKQLLAYLDLPEVIRDTQTDFVLHPSIVDGAFQAATLLMVGQDTSNPLMVPFAIGSVHIFRPTPVTPQITARYSTGSSALDSLPKIDIDISDEQGNVSVRFSRFCSRKLGNALSTPQPKQKAPQPLVVDTHVDPGLPLKTKQKSFEDRVLNFLKRQLAEVLKAQPESLDADARFENFGIDSVMSIDLILALDDSFDELPATLFFEVQTIRQLGEYLVEHQLERLQAIIGSEQAEAVTEPLTAPQAVTADEPPRKLKIPLLPSQAPTTSHVSHVSHDDNDDDEIAIIGLSGRYPKAQDLNQFWQNLQAGLDCITEIPLSRWDHSRYFDPDRNQAGKSNSKWGGFIDGVAEFDPLFFNISPREAEFMDPQERLFLQCVYETIEDAGYTRENLTHSSGKGATRDVGVFVGVMYEEYQLYGAQAQMQGNNIGLGGFASSIANRVSYVCNFHGPSIALDTMCSSSLTALHLAMQHLRNEPDALAIVGGVNVSIHPNKYLVLAQGRFTSSKGRCESFGEGGDGYVPAEGVGAILLKRKKAAIADGDHIYGLVSATSINHGGRTNGYTVPSPLVQRDVIARCLKDAQLNPQVISYIEAHGTGTALGDPIEIDGLTKAFNQLSETPLVQTCAIGSVKSNIGHCESAAGIAGITKILLQMKHRKLVPSLHSTRLNSNIVFGKTPFKVQQTLEEWRRPVLSINGELKEYPRIAGLSSFGAGGANAHAIIKEYVMADEFQNTSISNALTNNTATSAIILLSAHSEAQLIQQAERLLAHLENQPLTDAQLPDLAYTLQVGREAMSERVATTVSTVSGLVEQLTQLIADFDSPFNGWLRGSIHADHGSLTMLGSDYDMKEVAVTWLEQEKYQPVLSLWVNGLNIDWQRIYPQDRRPRRLSLPTYPFAKESYWADLPSSALIQESAADSGLEAYVPVWEPVKSLPSSLTPQFGKGTFVIDCSGGAASSMSTLPNVNYLTVSAISSIPNLLRAIEQSEKLAHLVWCLPKGALSDSLDNFIHDQENGLLFGLRLFKGLAELGYDIHPLQLTVITWQTQAINNEILCPAHASVHGLLGSVAKEYGHWAIRVVDLSLEEGKQQLEQSFGLPDDPAGNAFAHRQGQWYHQRLTPVPLPAQSPVSSAYKHNGVYVVVGGAGGLGETWSEWIIRNYQAHVVWFGRRASDADIQAKIRRLASLGPAPLYIQADVSDRESLDNAVKQVHATYGKVNGIVHSSLVLNDRSLSNMDETSFRVSIAAKIDTSVRIIQAFDHDPLDFALFFSSLASFSKPAGQCNYAAGCLFTDAFAHYLSQVKNYPGKVINWGYWGSVGVAVDEKLRTRMRASGLESIEPAEGMAALNHLLAAPFNQMVLVKVNDTNAIARLCGMDSGFQTTAVNTLPSRDETPVIPDTTLSQHQVNLMREQISPAFSSVNLQQETDKAQLSDRVRTAVRECIAAVLRIDLSKIRDNQAFAEYGVDSIIAVNLINQINKQCGLSLNTTVIFDYSTAEKLVSHIITQHADKLPASFRQQVSQQPEKISPAPQQSIPQARQEPSSALRADHDTVGRYEVESDETGSDEIGTYHRVEIRGPGTLDDVHLVKAGLAPLASDQVRVAIKAYSLNFGDLLCISGLYPTMPPYPFTPGFESAGIVVEVGQDVEDVAIGDEVIVIAGDQLGGHATVATCHPKQLLTKPEGISFQEACSLPIVGITMLAAFDKLQPQAGETIVIQTATSGVGLIAVALAKHWSLEIIATAGSEDKLHYLRQLGVKHCINYESQDFEKEVMAITHGAGVDIVINTLPGEAINKGLRSLAASGRYVELAMTALKAMNAVDLSVLKDNQSFHSIDLRRLGKARPEKIRAYWQQLVGLLEAGVIRPTLSQILPIEHFKAAYARLQDRRNIGKVVVEISKPYQYQGKPTPVVQDPLSEKIAIIGMSGRFPQSDNLTQLWQHLANGDDLITATDRWPLPAQDENGRPLCREGGFLTDIDKFDARFFNVSDSEATYMDPQQRLFLEEAWNALEDAGYAGVQNGKNQCGVYVGCTAGDYSRLFQSEPPAQSFWGNASSVIAARISYYLDLKGPAITVDTACSSSLVAMHLACQALRNKESDLALAGGVYVQSTSEFYRASNRAGMLSPTNRCHTFDETADGFVPSEGVGIVVLKRLHDALKDGDHIYGVIRGMAINQDGATNGITAPSAASQMELERQVYDRFNIDPADIQYVEAHGTGTRLGDPIELEALTKAFRQDTDKTGYCAIGSIKSNLGHTITTAGVAGVLKVLLSMQHRQIPPSIHYQRGNPDIDFHNSPFYVNDTLKHWNTAEGKKRLATVSSFGFSGTNAHMVIEDFAGTPSIIAKPTSDYLIVLSARNERQLTQVARRLLNHLRQRPETDISHVAFTLLLGRRHHEYRLATVVRDLSQLTEHLVQWCTDPQTPAFWLGDNSQGHHAQPEIRQKGLQALALCQASSLPEQYRAHLATIAELYVQGYDLPYEKLFKGSKPARISLPTYPFERRRYWVETTVNPISQAAYIPQAPVIQPPLSATGNQHTAHVEPTYHRHGGGNNDPHSHHGDAQVNNKPAILNAVKTIIKDVSGIHENEINEHVNIFQIGLDSMMLMKIKQIVESEFGVDVQMSEFYSKTDSVDKLATYICHHAVQPSVSDNVLPDHTLPHFPSETPVTITHTQAYRGDNATGKKEVTTLSHNPEKPQTSHTLTSQQQQFIQDFILRFNARTRSSKEFIEQNRSFLSDWINVLGFRHDLKELVYPVVAQRAEGSKFWDADGNAYVDIAMGYGVSYFGHNPAMVKQALEQQIQIGFPLGPQCATAGKVAELICQLTGAERVAFSNTGTEAIMTALRLARCVSRRSKVVIFENSYHGFYDGVLATAAGQRVLPVAPGILQNQVNDTVVLKYNDPHSLDVIRSMRHELAAVVVEPVQTRALILPTTAYLNELRAITQESGIALIFDEVVTGFRVCPGGAQQYFNIKADMAIYGKLVGGGLPIGVVTGIPRYLDGIDGGEWRFGDHSAPQKEMTFFAGTFCKHPLTMVTAYTVLNHLKQQGPGLQQTVNARMNYLADTLNDFFVQENVPFHIRHFGPTFRFMPEGKDRTTLQHPIAAELFYHLLMEKGIYTWERRICNLSTAHSDADINAVIQATKSAIAELRSGGFL
ncbi:aminotransferase class III-fold pyridoxal phosphate-dependent enzyme [Xenorhabdus bovienii]|uniref:aminotransferase class III-fold pyridoxal phosphate-dependent enzyme n=1 Tax=Xenorhabdus bovienii TaxID=40576 RepID=UPI00237CA921|nr:aminotransferase class III-fold pyridoxal phosphate-dependent enzyme [Xenorhabdus bovienii]MDE1483371.1 aminotransferase class III-fold pyridoxal phosphate-dependent enzyme [Xenorhabdus bovienii]